uniref:HTH psq-type domain-containing protein n=1 Tax=Plectus sambesii TaxID=2011161 RepID=A0A914WJF3_9BILA
MSTQKKRSAITLHVKKAIIEAAAKNNNQSQLAKQFTIPRLMIKDILSKKDAILKAIDGGGKVYFGYSKVAQVSWIAAENPQLCPPPSLVKELLLASKANRTVSNYLATITQFVAWHQAMHCADGVLDGPAAVALFLAQE